MASSRSRMKLFIVCAVIGGGLAFYVHHRDGNPSHHLAQLRSSDPVEHHAASDALTEIGQPAVLALVAALDDQEIRPRVINVLHQIGPAAREAVPALSELAKSSDTPTRVQALKALGQIGAAKSVPSLINALDDNDASVRSSATVALGRVGNVADSVVPALRRMLDDDAVRATAVSALAQLGPAAADAVPALVAALRNDEPDADPARVAWALAQIGPGAKEAVPALIDAMGASDDQLRANAAAALGSIGPAAKDAVPVLIDAVKGDPGPADGGGGFGQNWAVPRSATAALGKIGPAAKSAVTVLTEALEHRDEDVREYAGISLRQIEPEAQSETDASGVNDEAT